MLELISEGYRVCIDDDPTYSVGSVDNVRDYDHEYALDDATCFGIYRSDRHQCFISHGELEIARVSFDGEILWRTGGADIFTNGIELRNDTVHVVDLNNVRYSFDIETGCELRQ